MRASSCASVNVRVNVGRLRGVKASSSTRPQNTARNDRSDPISALGNAAAQMAATGPFRRAEYAVGVSTVPPSIHVPRARASGSLRGWASLRSAIAGWEDERARRRASRRPEASRGGRVNLERHFFGRRYRQRQQDRARADRKRSTTDCISLVILTKRR